ncbi:hypothetical protein Tco_1393962 [Tanacetum coccineum]
MASPFRPEPPYVLLDGIIPLIKSVLAVPTKGSLIVKEYMEDAKSDKVIMDGCCKFKPLLEYGCISGTIARRDVCSLDLRVSTDIAKITRKQSKMGKHGHGKWKSTKEAKDSKP